MIGRNRKIIIFDFDGVLANSLDIVVSIMKDLARFSLTQKDRILSQKDSNYFRGLSSDEFYFSLPKWKLLIGVLYTRVKLTKYIDQINIEPGLKEELDKLKTNNYILGIVSSNSVRNITKFLDNNNINYFDFIHSSSAFLRKEKKLKKVMEENGFSPGNVVFVGDETRDIVAAKNLGLKIIAVSWGYTFEHVLKKYNPDFLINKPEELLGVINQI